MLKQSYRWVLRNKPRIHSQSQHNQLPGCSIRINTKRNPFQIKSQKWLSDKPDSFRYVEKKGELKINTINTSKTNNVHGRKVGVTSSSFRGISGDKIISIVRNLEAISIGSLQHVHFREACQALDTMSHFKVTPPTNGAWEAKTKGELGWTILKRLLVENGAVFDEEKDTFDMQKIERHCTHQMDSKVFHDGIKCMASSKDPTLINAADNLLLQLETHFLATKSPSIHPVGRSYALLLDGIKDIESDSAVLVVRVKQIMKRFKKQQEAGNKHVVVNSQLYNSVLNVLAFHSSQRNPVLTKTVQEMMLDSEAPLDVASYSIAMKSLLSTNKWSDIIESSDGITTAKAIENILSQMQKRGLGNPNVKIMTPILHALSDEGNIEEIMNLIEWMEDMYESRGWEDIRPNNYHFNNMITALTNRNSQGKVRSGSGRVAFQILNKMKTLYEGGNVNVRPDLITYNAVLNAIAKEENATGVRRVNEDIIERAETLLKRMENGDEGEHIIPDVFSYNAVLTAFMNSSVHDAATKAKKMLENMVERDVQPDLVSYTICINTLSKSKVPWAAQSAHDLLNLLEENYENGCEALKPDVTCYNSGKGQC